MTDLQLIRQWEKEEAEKRQRAKGLCRCQDCKNWRLRLNSWSCRCVYKDVSVTNKRGVAERKYWNNTPGNWRKCDRYEDK